MARLGRLLGMSGHARVAVFGAEKWHVYDDELNGPACGAIHFVANGEAIVEDALTTVRNRIAGERCRRAACSRRWPPPLRLVS